MKRRSPVSEYPTMATTRGSAFRAATDWVIAPWNSGEVASVPDDDRKSAMKLLLPAEKDASRRSMTAADSEDLSSQPPELSSPAAFEAKTIEPSASRSERTAIGRRKR